MFSPVTIDSNLDRTVLIFSNLSPSTLFALATFFNSASGNLADSKIKWDWIDSDQYEATPYK